MNGASLTFSQDELALLQQVVRHGVDRPIRGIHRLETALKSAKPGSPYHFAAAEIAAADAAFAYVIQRGVLPKGLESHMQEVFSSVTATIAAAAVD